MKIDSVDFFYLKIPTVRDVGDGSQDMLLVRVSADGHVGWGDCEASPLTSIASFVAPMSHSACRPVRDSVLGERLDDPSDIARIVARVHSRSFDLLQAAHTVSGIEIALWDLMGKRLSEPVWRLLGAQRSFKKRPYASVLFGDDPQSTLVKAREISARGFHAAKFGWGAYGHGSVAEDADHVAAAREGLGPDATLMVDAGTAFDEDVDAAAQRLPALESARVLWLEEPFAAGAFRSYRALAEQCRTVRLAGGEASHDPMMAEHLIDYAGIGYVQVDAGRIGGIGNAARVAAYATSRGINYVNHTFTSQLALSASLQPFAGLPGHEYAEYPIETSELARSATDDSIEPDAEGMISAPDAPGLGIRVSLDGIRPFLQDVAIEVNGVTLYSTPQLRN